jgi:glutathione peroxidase
MSTLYDIPVETITGEPSSLGAYKGKVLLVVNVASQCGLTPQYHALQKLYSRYKDRGLVVIGFPANDFGAQEPGSNTDIAAFCKMNYGVEFPMFSKIAVTGDDTHPLYEALVREQPTSTGPNRAGFRQNLEDFLANTGGKTNPEPGILWNFEKFLVGRNGRVIGRFSPEITPDDPLLVNAIDSALAGT